MFFKAQPLLKWIRLERALFEFVYFHHYVLTVLYMLVGKIQMTTIRIKLSVYGVKIDIFLSKYTPICLKPFKVGVFIRTTHLRCVLVFNKSKSVGYQVLLINQ